MAQTVTLAKVTSVTEPLAELLSETSRGDRQAFQRVYRLASPKLFAIALRIAGRRDLAEEILQEAFLTVWRKADQYNESRGKPLAWMATIVRHRAIDRLRRDGREPRRQSELPEAGLGAQDLATARFAAGAAEDVRGCLDRLQDKQRKAILLAYYYGLSHEELAVDLDAPLGTVKSWVRRGLLRLKDCLEE